MPETFKSTSKCRDYLHNVHSNALIDTQLDSLVSLGARPLGIEQGTSCPLYREFLASFNQYQRHVSGHQQQLPLFALPLLDSTIKDEPDSEPSNIDEVNVELEDFSASGIAIKELAAGDSDAVFQYPSGWRPERTTPNHERPIAADGVRLYQQSVSTYNIRFQRLQE